MRTSSRELRDLFGETCAATAGEPEPGFTLLLEHRLRALDRTGIAPVAPVAPVAADHPSPRSVTRQQRPRTFRPTPGRALRPSLLLAAVVAVVVIASLSLRGGAPASQLHTTHPTPLSPGAGSEPAPDRTAVVSPTATSVPTGPGPSVAPVVIPPAAPARPSTTVKSSTSTTDSYSPQSIRLTCGAGSVSGQATASCKWTASTASDFARYVVLRTGGGKNRVVFSTQDRGTTSYIDTTLVRGTPYTFLVDALRADGSVLAHSNVVPVSCCP